MKSKKKRIGKRNQSLEKKKEVEVYTDLGDLKKLDQVVNVKMTGTDQYVTKKVGEDD